MVDLEKKPFILNIFWQYVTALFSNYESLTSTQWYVSRNFILRTIEKMLGVSYAFLKRSRYRTTYDKLFFSSLPLQIRVLYINRQYKKDIDIDIDIHTTTTTTRLQISSGQISLSTSLLQDNSPAYSPPILGSLFYDIVCIISCCKQFIGFSFNLRYRVLTPHMID